MKTRTKILILAVTLLAIGLFFIFITANGFSIYDKGMGLDYLPEHEFQE